MPIPTTVTTDEAVRWPRPGELVYAAGTPSRVFRIESVQRVNMSVVDETGKRWRLPIVAARYCSPDTVFAGPAKDTTRYVIGEVVRITTGRFASPTSYVVIKVVDDRLNLAKLGGDNGRSVRVFKGSVEKVAL